MEQQKCGESFAKMQQHCNSPSIQPATAVRVPQKGAKEVFLHRWELDGKRSCEHKSSLSTPHPLTSTSWAYPHIIHTHHTHYAHHTRTQQPFCSNYMFQSTMPTISTYYSPIRIQCPVTHTLPCSPAPPYAHPMPPYAPPPYLPPPHKMPTTHRPR